MTDGPAILAAILERPADDQPRRCYADLCREAGDVDLADFIEIQLELARTKVHPNGHTDVGPDRRFFVNEARDCTRADCRACELRRRERDLFAAHGDSWYPIKPAGFANWDWSRGFISSVTLSLAAFVGCRCGDGTVYTGDFPALSVAVCPACGGRGTAPGVAKRLAETCPLETVTLSDREPHEDGGEWQWASASDTSEWRFDAHRESLPWPLAQHIQGGRHHPERGSVVAQWWYPTREAALAALSLAACRFARGLAGLPDVGAATGHSTR